MANRSFEGKRVVLTGAASGIGRALALATGWLLKRLSPELAFQVTRWVAKRTGIMQQGIEQ